MHLFGHGGGCSIDDDEKHHHHNPQTNTNRCNISALTHQPTNAVDYRSFLKPCNFYERSLKDSQYRPHAHNRFYWYLLSQHSRSASGHPRQDVNLKKKKRKTLPLPIFLPYRHTYVYISTYMYGYMKQAGQMKGCSNTSLSLVAELIIFIDRENNIPLKSL